MASTMAARIAVCSHRCCAVQKNSTPRRKPTNSGGSPSGLSAPPTLATRMMKNTTTWALCSRLALARSSGRIRIMAAPVVPTMLAISVPKAEDRGVGERRAAQLAGHQDAAGDDIEREQQHDEAEVFRRAAHARTRRPRSGRRRARRSARSPARPRRTRICRSGDARAAGTAAARRRWSAGCRRTAAPTASRSAAPSSAAAWAASGASVAIRTRNGAIARVRAA